MHNAIMLIGRLTCDPQKYEIEKCCMIELAVTRCYKNEEGIYETDFIPIKLTNGIAESTCEYCKKGDLIGIQGRIARLSRDEDIEIIADKVSFLAQRKENEDERRN